MGSEMCIRDSKYRLWAKGELEVESLTDANFSELKIQRDNDIEGNEPLKDAEGYSRVWMVRYPPENESTSQTRKEGLRVLKSFFMSSIATDYPPKEIKIIDDTRDVPAILDRFFLDSDIEEIMRSSFDVTEFEESFFENYTEVARTIYSEKKPSEFARFQLGFPELD